MTSGVSTVVERSTHNHKILGLDLVTDPGREKIAKRNFSLKYFNVSAGEIVNLINVDCQKLVDACLFVNMMWSCPLQVSILMTFYAKCF
jgi:hypothetical protein